MKIAFISDIHSNLEAFRAVLVEIDKENVSLIVNLGDLVGYNASPRECVDLVKQRQMISILGNHDRAAIEPKFAEGFNILAYQALVWSSPGTHQDALGPLPPLSWRPRQSGRLSFFPLPDQKGL